MNKGSFKFGTFKGVFIPSVLSILGVIMYLRLPWIVGEAGLLGTLSIILIAHVISVTTGLSISSLATDKKVEKGGSYYIISRSLGLPIGGTLGLAFFVGLSFSVSLYLIGFSEVFLSALGFEVTKDAIRLTGVMALLFVTILTFISTNLALKTQILIFLVLILSLVSIFFGQHHYQPTQPLLRFASESYTWIALFAIFFPAVTGFGAGVSMSGDLRNPKKSIPIGTMAAIFAGLIIYAGLSIFLSYNVDREFLRYDPAVLLNISLNAPIVIAGIWAATLSSALGSILGAPRILQATAIDKITPKIFSKSFGKANEPRNALLMTFVIALSGVLIGDLNIIARIVTIFFIITYGFLNLTCAIENWAGSDFRPSFKIPVIISLIGAFSCFVIMIQLDFIAMIAAVLILGTIFIIIKRKELKLQSGDTWSGVWSSVVKFGLKKLSLKKDVDKRNWRPNIILFSGGAKSRPHLVEMARSMVGRLGVFTNFELVEDPSGKVLFSKQSQSIIDTDHLGKTLLTRRHECGDIYQGMDLICRVYGFSGFEPNTILLGWSRNTKNPERFVKALKNLIQLNYNIAILSFDRTEGFGNKKQIDVWWKGYGRDLSYSLTLLKFITSDPVWRSAKVNIKIINYDSSYNDKLYDIATQMLYNSRLPGKIKIINNSVERAPEKEIIKNESSEADLTLIALENSDIDPETNPLTRLSEVISQIKTTLIIKASNEFDEVNVFGSHALEDEQQKTRKEIIDTVASSQIYKNIKLPEKEILANEVKNFGKKFQEIQEIFLKNGYGESSILFNNYFSSFKELPQTIFSQAIKIIEDENKNYGKNPLDKIINDFAFQTQNNLIKLNDEIIPEVKSLLYESINNYLKNLNDSLNEVPEHIIVKHDRKDYSVKKEDKAKIRSYKLKKKLIATILRKQVKQKVEIKKPVKLFLVNRRLETLNAANTEFRAHSYKMVAKLKNHFSDILEVIEKVQKNINQPDKALQIIRMEQSRIIMQQEKIQEETKQTIEQITNTLYSDLSVNLQKTSYILSDIVSKFKLKYYEKLLKKRGFEDKLKEMPDIWHNNLTLFINKSKLEFILVAYKNRIKTKLNKKISELNLFIESNLLNNLKTLKEQVELFEKDKKTQDPENIRKLAAGIKEFDLFDTFEKFFNEVIDITAGLPEKTIINHEEFLQQIEKGQFEASETKTINVRRKVEFFIGTELINSTRLELEQTNKELNKSLNNIKDIIRLTLFNLENIPDQDEDINNENNKEKKNILLEGLIKRIDKEEQDITVLMKETSGKLNKYLNYTFENINIISLSHKTESAKKSKTIKKDSLIKQKLSRKKEKIQALLKNQMVKALYTKSEGLILAEKITSFEKQHKIDSQSIHEILEIIVPNRKILTEIPFYYLSLFSGSSTINKDLWVGMESQIKESQKTFERFENGYRGGLLITGERDSGKSSLAKMIAKQHAGDYITHIIKAPKGKKPTDDFFKESIKKSFNTENSIIEYLNTQYDKKIIIIDDFELWWQKTDDGHVFIDKFLDLINTFGNKFFFIVNCNVHAYKFISSYYDINNCFLGHCHCEALDAKNLKELIMLRHKAGGFKFKLNNKNEEDFTEWDFAKLFNKYFELTNGTPGQTAKAWINNIKEISNDILIIDTPKKPKKTNLDDISDDLWIIILQFVLHRRMDEKKLSEVLLLNEQLTKTLIRDLLRTAIIEEKFKGIYALNPYIEPFFVKKMKEKQIL